MSGNLMRTSKRLIFRYILEKNPGLLRIARQIQFFLWQRLRPKTSDDQLNDILLWVNPKMINLYIGDLPWSRFSMQGRVEDGDWDLSADPFQGWDLFKAMQHRFVEGGDWKETNFYKRVIKEIEHGGG